MICTYLREMIKQINKKLLIEVLLCTFVIGMICHGYCYFNSSFSHDSLVHLYYKDVYKDILDIGRFLRPIYSFIKGDIALPWINGFFSLLFIGLSNYLLIKILNINNRFFRYLTCFVLTTNSSISLLNATYFHDVDSYALALLFAVIGLYYCLNKKYLLFCLFNVLSLGLYQAYMQVTVFLLIVISIIKLIKNNNWKEEAKDLLISMFFMCLSMIIYFIIYRLTLMVLSIDVSGAYNSIENVTEASEISIIVRIKAVLSSELDWLLGISNNNSAIVLLINVIVFALIFYLLIKLFIKEKTCRINCLFVFILCLIGLFGIGCIILLMGSYHGLMMYSYFFVYIFLLLVAELYNNRRIIQFIIVLLLVVTYDNVIFANKAYLKKDLESKSTLSMMTRVVDRMENTEGYEVGVTPVVFIGFPNDGEMQEYKDGVKYNSVGLGDVYSITYYQCYKNYFEYILGYPINICDEKIAREYSKKPSIKKMKSFPAKNSCIMINGVLVVKISDM